MMAMVHKPIAITMGDPSGVGPEIIVRAFREAPELTTGCVVIGSLPAMRRANGWIGADGPRLPIAAIDTLSDLAACPSGAMPVLDVVGADDDFPVGRIDAASGRAAGRCVEWAADAALRGSLQAVVTAPLHKEALARSGEAFAHFPGHTEMLQAAAARHLGRPVAEVPVRMMLANDELRVVLVSIHVSLREALSRVTQAQVLETLQITHQALQNVLGRAPRIAVAGLNPHAGEGGLFGDEELREIAPAIEAANAHGITAKGPFSPDTVFMRARRPAGSAEPEFDAVVAMYHDQGLIPVKYLGVDQGVNITLGLPFVRTSPDHGTAFDIAGTGRASAASLIAAIRMARQGG
ncbi:MAG: hypothetical protein RLZZ126_1707 [Pseudomonadota bacterium]|jgi:4-hydroxythreonine-4-phosphate dehydrogenase